MRFQIIIVDDDISFVKRADLIETKLLSGEIAFEIAGPGVGCAVKEVLLPGNAPGEGGRSHVG